MHKGDTCISLYFANVYKKSDDKSKKDTICIMLDKNKEGKDTFISLVLVVMSFDGS